MSKYKYFINDSFSWGRSTASTRDSRLICSELVQSGGGGRRVASLLHRFGPTLLLNPKSSSMYIQVDPWRTAVSYRAAMGRRSPPRLPWPTWGWTPAGGWSGAPWPHTGRTPPWRCCGPSTSPASSTWPCGSGTTPGGDRMVRLH